MSSTTINEEFKGLEIELAKYLQQNRKVTSLEERNSLTSEMLHKTESELSELRLAYKHQENGLVENEELRKECADSKEKLNTKSRENEDLQKMLYMAQFRFQAQAISLQQIVIQKESLTQENKGLTDGMAFLRERQNSLVKELDDVRKKLTEKEKDFEEIKQKLYKFHHEIAILNETQQ